jgi:RNA polymerase sigma-70 factor, ECF subfamily
VAELPDGELVGLALEGDHVAFRLLVERHQPAVRARARELCANSSDVEDVAQEAFVRAYISLDRLRDPGRFAAWLAGITANVCRGLRGRDPRTTLLPDWPDTLHPRAADGVPSADELDRSDALRAAIGGLPAGQRRAVVLHYYAGLPAAQVAESAGAARVSLHKARQRLRAYLTEHRPDLVPAVVRRPAMTTVRIVRIEHVRHPAGPRRAPAIGLVLADDAGQRELPIWLLPSDGHRLVRLFDPERPDALPTADALVAPMMRAIGAVVTSVDIEELGPEVTAARITLNGPAGTRLVTARLVEGLAVAITTGAAVRVANEVMDRLALPAGATAARSSSPSDRWHQRRSRPRYEPRNLAFADGDDGLDGWLFGGSFAEHVSESHWRDYTCAAEGGIAVISAAVPEPAGFAILGQEVFADDYRGSTVVFSGEFRVLASGGGRAGMFLRVNEGRPVRGPLTWEALFADPDNNVTPVPNAREWVTHQISARVPGDTDAVVFGIFLAGPGRIELRDPHLRREL